jgi:ubiquinone/menaquinone biosynthesis C-methylase UbiE/uncharacterized protein YbaR (Trm112 family)
MHKDFLEILRCPITQSKLNLVVCEEQEGKIKNGFLVCQFNSDIRYPIVNYIPRFVSSSNYADNFGFQWNKFSKTQFDSYTNQPITFKRFWTATGWNANEMKDQLVLDAGCGSGRFAEISLQSEARVVAIDFSNSVDAAYQNLSAYPNLLLVQADIYRLPFNKNIFSFIYSLGVLQHTPDPKKSFDSLTNFLKPGGRICVDLYWKRLQTILHPKYLFRPITKKMEKNSLFTLIEKATPTMLAISNFLLKIPVFGKALSRLIPVANYKGIYNLSSDALLQWAILDTFDWFSPTYDNPQTHKTLMKWFVAQELVDIEIFHEGHLVARGKKNDYWNRCI